MLQSGSQSVVERRALGFATALHIAALFAVWGWGMHHALPAHAVSVLDAPVEAPAQEFDVEELLTSLSPTADPTAGGSRSGGSIASERAANIKGSRVEMRVHGIAAAGVESEANTSRAATEGSELTQNDAPDSAEAPASPNIDLGLRPDGWQRWLGSTLPDRSSQASSTRPRGSDHHPLFRASPKSTTGGLQEGLEAEDRARGLGPSGPVISALYHAAHSSAAPETGVARFQVTVLDTGSVEVTLREASDHYDGWRAVATAAADALRRVPPRIPKARSGMRLTLEITAEEIMPSGTKTKQLYGPRIEVAPPRFRATADAQADLKNRNPVAGEDKQLAAGTHANVDLPGVYLAERGKVCGYRIGLSLLGPTLNGGCDLSNLGARPQRMVHTRVLDEVLFSTQD